MRRYCQTILQKFYPCDIGWGMTDNTGTKSCYDEPKEQNCHNLVDENNLACPLCGQEIKEKINEVLERVVEQVIDDINGKDISDGLSINQAPSAILERREDET